MDERIWNGEVREFAVVVCDINDLKKANDTLGHMNGDSCIRRASNMLSGVFAHSSVYRIGGDEFAVILTGEDYENRQALLEQVRENIRRCNGDPGRTLAVGMSEFVKGEDNCVLDVFSRADYLMYTNKNEFKASMGRKART